MRRFALTSLTALSLSLAACGGRTPNDGSGGADLGACGALPSGCVGQSDGTCRLDCNTCSCGANGAWACTLMGCLDAGPGVCAPRAGCTPTAPDTCFDGCNTCSCTPSGWACTERACVDAGPGDPCDGVSLPTCPPPCGGGFSGLCGQTCSTEGATCGNAIGDGMTCTGGHWGCAVHPPLGGPGVCNLVCRGATAYEPCRGKACGASCSVCPPWDTSCVETAVLKACGSDGSCAPQATACSVGDCATDADCRLVDDYCTGCDCRSLAPGESLPACTGPGVNCFVAPCANKTAACVSGQCAVR